MCGLVGFLGGSICQSVLDTMTKQLTHRGPDAIGTWVDENQQIGLGHTRLSIQDLSTAGAQPMKSLSQRYIIVFNGEIYNHLVLRKELGPNIMWRGHSDTETLLAGFDRWGIETMIKRSVGMFAFAVWDRQLSVLTLGRDRAGEKPLYYGWQKGIFLFGSELKSLKQHPAFSSQISRDALSLYMQFNNVPAPYCIWENIYKLMPGSLLTISLNGEKEQHCYYWDPRQVFLQKKLSAVVHERSNMLNELEHLLLRSVEEKMSADVPVGAFLSGGIDSSLIVALMQRLSSQKIRTYSIGFESKKFNEAIYAADIARHLGTQHTELYLTSGTALNIIPNLSSIYDEPFADSSQIPTIMVSKLARQDVAVVLSGDAGDELFAGYSRYLLAHQIWRYLSSCPLKFRQLLGSKLKNVPEHLWGKYFNRFTYLLPKRFRAVQLSNKLMKFFSVMAAKSPIDLYLHFITQWQNYQHVMLDGKKLLPPQAAFNNFSSLHYIEEMMFCDFIHYLGNDILTKVDRASMSVSLETRVPFLDHRVVEFAWSLPLDYKISNQQAKWPLRQILYKYVPQNLIERPKMGFGIPLDEWLKGSLREWANDLLSPAQLQKHSFFDPVKINCHWQDFFSGKNSVNAHELWNILMFQAWLEVQ